MQATIPLFWRYCALEFIGHELEFVFDFALNWHGSSAAKGHKGSVTHKTRFGNEYLVALRNYCAECRIYAFACSDGYDDFIVRIVADSDKLLCIS